MIEINEQSNVLTIGKTQFNLAHLRSITLEEAVKTIGGRVHEDRVRNAWKRANKKK